MAPSVTTHHQQEALLRHVLYNNRMCGCQSLVSYSSLSREVTVPRITFELPSHTTGGNGDAVNDLDVLTNGSSNI